MGSPIRNVDWVEKNEMMDCLLNQEDNITTHPMDQGFEAEVKHFGEPWPIYGN